jgi:glycosyltransferase involved in cell wall biosynthesis
MRVLVVSHYFSSHGGGVERVAGLLAREFHHAGAVVRWMASDCNLPDALPMCIPARSTNVVERLLGLPYPIWSPGALRRLWREVGACDVVHLHDGAYMGNACAALFARWRGRPVVVTQHVGDIGRSGAFARLAAWLLHRTVTRCVLSSADRVFFVSPEVQRYFAAICNFRMPPVVVPNGVDGKFYAYVDREKPVRPRCLFVGRFVPRKGIELLVEVARRMPEVDWIFAGNGLLRPEEAGLPNVTVLRGKGPADIVPLYQSADLLVLPSTGEGFPLVVQEALSCGAAVLVSAETAAGAPEAASLLHAEAELSPERWRARIAGWIAAGDDKRAVRAAAARQLWSWRSTAEAYLQAMKALGGRTA